MVNDKPIARHVFHPATSGTDRLHAWQQATDEPFFVWGNGSGGADHFFFGPVKRAFREWLGKTRGARLTVYHDGVGADALGPLDTCENKVLLTHTWFPRWEKNFEWMLRCTGKVIVPGHGLAGVVREKFPWIPARYIHPITSPCLRGDPPEGGSGAARRTGIWLHGSKWKRCGNRLRSIVDRWNEDAGELEIITSGKAPAWSQKPFVIWSTELPFHFALMRLYTWDSCLLLNDFSLDQPWLVRALELGCFPIVPEGSNLVLNAGWREESAPQPYEWGDIEAARELLNQWRQSRDELEIRFNEWAEKLVARHDPARFPGEWEAVKDQVLQSRPPRLRARRPAGSTVPVAWYERVQRLRAGM